VQIILQTCGDMALPDGSATPSPPRRNKTSNTLKLILDTGERPGLLCAKTKRTPLNAQQAGAPPPPAVTHSFVRRLKIEAWNSIT